MLEQLFGIPDPVAFITGSGADRIGNCVARAMARRGYRVVLHARTSGNAARATASELQAEGTSTLVVEGDVADEAAVKNMVRRIVDQFGRIDALVNSAAIWESRRLEEVTAADVRRHLDVNTLGTFLCCQHVGLRMTEQSHGGAIVNLGDWAIARPYPDYSAYFPSKGSIPAMTRSFAVELSRRNPRVRVNAVLPGPAMMPATVSPEARRAAIDGTLLRREGSPDHVADAAIFLIENDFITGVCLPVDGGRTIC